MELIQGQWSNEGGVRWKVDGDYIASISTLEAAQVLLNYMNRIKTTPYCHLLRNVFHG